MISCMVPDGFSAVRNGCDGEASGRLAARWSKRAAHYDAAAMALRWPPSVSERPLAGCFSGSS